ncbi:hypothetical protein [Streptomyces sp. KL116D]|uniref:hypothetical protein n=1 Tax=Streptomyces sp. KL116D TaxID=3045152 RepID=UPI003557E028
MLRSAVRLPYWRSYTYDASGNRKTETQHSPTGNTAQDINRTYTYPGPGQAQAHSLKTVHQQLVGHRTDQYAYDTTGNTTARPGQTLQWDAEGHLAKVTEAATPPATSTTLTAIASSATPLPRPPSTSATPKSPSPAAPRTPKATRYIDLGSGQTAVRNDDGTFTFTIGDHQGTGQLAINAADLA